MQANRVFVPSKLKESLGALKRGERLAREVKIYRVFRNGATQYKCNVKAMGLRDALAVFYRSDLQPAGHMAPLYVGNKMSTTNGIDVYDWLALDVYQDPMHQVT